MSQTQEARKYLESEGFYFKRHCGSGHVMYTDGVNTITVSGSPSDRRALQRIKSDVKRVRR